MPDLLEHQHEAVAFLAARQRALLADDPGLGKTIEAIAAADRIGARRILVAGPAVSRVNWAHEFRKWQQLDREVVVVERSIDVANACRRNSDHVLIVSYDAVRGAFDELRLVLWDLLILDEGHMLKSPNAQRTTAIYGDDCRAGPDSVVASANRTWVLTGTPVLSGVHELWTHARALWSHGGEGWPLTYTQWLDQYCQWFEGPHGVRVTGNKNLPELKEALGAFILRRRIEDVMPSFPAVFVTEARIPLDLRALGELDGYAAQVDGLDEILRAAAGGTGPGFGPEGAHIAAVRRMLGLAKLRGTAEYLAQELDGGVEKVIVFAHHRDVVLGLHKTLARYGSKVIMGDTPAEQRTAAVAAFQTDPKTRVFVGNIASAGTAITLTASHHVYMAEADWLPEINRQAIGRARRIGQTMPVFAKFLVADHPLDEAMTATLARRTRIVREFETSKEPTA